MELGAFSIKFVFGILSPLYAVATAVGSVVDDSPDSFVSVRIYHAEISTLNVRLVSRNRVAHACDATLCLTDRLSWNSYSLRPSI